MSVLVLIASGINFESTLLLYVSLELHKVSFYHRTIKDCLFVVFSQLTNNRQSDIVLDVSK